ncbi:MAG: ferredoxin--NADP reductase, partial [Alphaproteobacteria bacterium]
DELLSEIVGDKLIHFTSTTREHSAQMGRITNLANSGELYEQIGMTKLNPADDRVMICGSMEMLQDTKAMCEAAGLVEGSVSRPGEFVIEKAFVD